MAVAAGDRRLTPTVSRLMLGSELRRLRLEAGLSQAEVADALRRPVSKLSMMENGQRYASATDLDTLLSLYEVPESQWARYLEAAEASRQHGFWESQNVSEVDEDLHFYACLEQGAAAMRCYWSAVVHALLQIEDYTVALLRQRSVPWSEEMIDHQVRQRSLRRKVLDDADPLEVRMIMAEPVLHHIVGNPNVMQAQLGHLADVAAGYANVDVRIIPFHHAGASAAHLGAFTIFSFPWTTNPGAVYVERIRRGTFLDSLSDINEYSVHFDHLVSLALSPERSIEMIHRIEKEHSNR